MSQVQTIEHNWRPLAIAYDDKKGAIYSRELRICERCTLITHVTTTDTTLRCIALRCEDCKQQKQSVRETTCPYDDDVEDIKTPAILCDECYKERQKAI